MNVCVKCVLVSLCDYESTIKFLVVLAGGRNLIISNKRVSKMKDLEITKELKCDIDYNQDQLKNAICNHQNYMLKLRRDPDNVELQKRLVKAEEQIILVGLEQKKLLDRLREEYKARQQVLKQNITKNGLEERRFNLANAISRARKQNIVPTTVIRSTSITSVSDDSVEPTSVHSSPEPHQYPTDPHDVTQTDFLNYFGLATHEVFKEMQNKRVERKRRSTANPHFMYAKGWDFYAGKRKRGAYLVSAISPPNTRQAVRKKTERISPPPAASEKNDMVPSSSSNGHDVLNGNSSSSEQKSTFKPFPLLPNLPSGLSILRISPGSASPNSKSCNTCKQPGSLSICEVCTSAFHISCHNRPFAQTPRQCPSCLTKEVRTVGSLAVPSGMTVTYVNPPVASEKISEKRQLAEKHKDLSAELTQLQDRHSQLTISLKNQKNQQEHLVTTQQSTEDKIQKILKFLNSVKMTSSEKAISGDEATSN